MNLTKNNSHENVPQNETFFRKMKRKFLTFSWKVNFPVKFEMH